MWGWRRARERRERHDHRELIDIGERQIRLSRSGLRWQAISATIGFLAVAVALLAWHPWSRAAARPLHARVKLAGGSHDAYVPSPPRSIPPPPPYSPSNQESRCEEWWRTWFEQQKAAEVNSPILEV